MYYHFTFLKVMPENVNHAANILEGYSTREYFRKLPGIRSGFLMESLDEPGKLLSFSIWDSMADALAVFSDPNYAGLIGDLRSLLITAPERYGHNLLKEQIFIDAPPMENMYVHNTILTVEPVNSPNLISILYSDQSIAFSRTVTGILRAVTFESIDVPGRIVSMSWWKTEGDAQKTFNMPDYAALLGDMRQFFIKAPERQGFKVMNVVLHSERGAA